MSKQLHKNFTDDQIKSLLKSYLVIFDSQNS